MVVIPDSPNGEQVMAPATRAEWRAWLEQPCIKVYPQVHNPLTLHEDYNCLWIVVTQASHALNLGFDRSFLHGKSVSPRH